MQRRTMAAGLAISAVLLTACSDSGNTSASVDDYPDGQITMIVPFPAGSGPDSTARTLAQTMEDELDERIVIQNKEGGAGTIGLNDLGNSEPDGYTISWMASPGLTTQWQRIDTPFEGPDAVTPVAQAISVVSMLFTNSESGPSTVEELVDAAKAAPGEISIGLPPEGSQQDIAVRLFEEAAGIELDKNYFDAGKQILPVVNGTVDLGVAQAAPVVQYVDRGDLSWVGVFGTTQPAGIDAPLISESGYEMDQAAIDGYEGLVAPAGVPDAIVQRLTEAAENAIESDEFQEYTASTYSAAQYVAPDELQTKIDDGVQASTELIEKYGL